MDLNLSFDLMGYNLFFDMGIVLTNHCLEINIINMVEFWLLLKSMIIEIKTDCDGELNITLPKEVLDTDENGFFVLVDGDETNHNAVSVPEFWTLTIPFSYGSEEIEIIGTYVIPEFGTIAILVLVAAITTIVMISAKNKQIFYPKI